MASFEEHVSQAKSNLIFLNEINNHSKFYDWQVTACFYVAVHLVNAHIAKTGGLHYKTHKEVKAVINHHNAISICKVDESTFTKYVSLEKLSRRSRYLCNENQNNLEKGFLTYDRHVSIAIKRLNEIMEYFGKKYSITFDNVKIKCPRVKAELSKPLKFFEFQEVL